MTNKIIFNRLRGINCKIHNINNGLSESRTNILTIDIYHGVDVHDIVNVIKEDRGLNVGYIPLSNEGVRRCKDAGVEYVDLYDISKAYDMDKGSFIGGNVTAWDYERITKYDVLIFESINAIEKSILHELLNELRSISPLTSIILITDTYEYNTSPSNTMNRERRIDASINSPIDRNTGYSAEVTYLASRYRKHIETSFEEKNIRSYIYEAVNSENYFEKLDVIDILDYDMVICSLANLYKFNNAIREVLGLTDFLPMVGDKLISYNAFRTEKGFVIRKGTLMEVVRVIGESVIEVKIDDELHKIVYDISVFNNAATSTNIHPLDNRLANVYFAYAIYSDLFIHVSFDNVYIYIDSMVSSMYMYTALRTCRKKIKVDFNRILLNAKIL